MRERKELPEPVKVQPKLVICEVDIGLEQTDTTTYMAIVEDGPSALEDARLAAIDRWMRKEGSSPRVFGAKYVGEKTCISNGAHYALREAWEYLELQK